MITLVNAALRVKLEAMTAENEKTILDENTSEVPSDRELFAGDVREEFSAGEVFTANRKDSVKDEDFQVPVNSAQATMTPQLVGTSRSSLATIRVKRFSTAQKVLAGSIIVIAVMLLYALLKSSSEPAATIARAPAERIPPVIQQAPSTKLPAEQLPKPSEPSLQTNGVTQKKSQQIPKASGNGSVDLETPTKPLSLKVAQDLYLRKDYRSAYTVYDQLRQNLPAGTEEQLLRDFLQLQMAFCMEKSRNYEQANHVSDQFGH